MRAKLPNSANGRPHELTRANAGPQVVEVDARTGPVFRLDIERSLRMHTVLAGTVAAVTFLLLALWALTRQPVYTSESLIYVEPLEVRVLNDGSSSGYDPSRYDSYLQQQVQTVQRADTLEAALAKLPPGMWSAPGENPASAVKQLGNALKVERVLNSYQLAIDVSAGRPEAAAAGANAVTSAYLEAGRKDEHTRADQRLQLLNEERERITEDMTRDKAEQSSLGRTLGVANPNGASGNPYDIQSEGLRTQLASARVAHDAVSAQLASVSGLNGVGLDTAANELIVTDPGLVSIKQTLSQRRAVLSDQMAGLTPANPVYRQDQEEIAELDRSIERASDDARKRAERQLQDKLRLDLRRTADVENRLNAQLAEQTSKATGAGPRLQRAAELETDLQRLGTRFATVDDAIRGLQLETGGPGQAHLALAARVPDAAEPNRSRLVLLLALPLALLCGIAAAVIARKRDRKLYLAGDVQEVLGFPPLCVLPETREVSPAAYEDFLLRLAGGLEGAYRYGGARSFVFTPVSVDAQGEGVLQRVCAKLRQLGFRAVCVNVQDLMPASGWVVETAVHEGLGSEMVRAGEGAGATRLQSLLEQHDLVLIQAPALLGSALTEYVVRRADATILLVESTRTDRLDLRRAALLLERLNPQGIGAVLQDMPLRYADSVFREAVRAADRSPLAHPEPSSRRSARSKAAQATAAVSKTILFTKASRPEESSLPRTRRGATRNGEIARETRRSSAELDTEPEAQPMTAQETPEPELPAYPFEPVTQEEPVVVPMEIGPLSFQEPVDRWQETGSAGFMEAAEVHAPPPAASSQPAATGQPVNGSVEAASILPSDPVKLGEGIKAWGKWMPDVPTVPAGAASEPPVEDIVPAAAAEQGDAALFSKTTHEREIPGEHVPAAEAPAFAESPVPVHPISVPAETASAEEPPVWRELTQEPVASEVAADMEPAPDAMYVAESAPEPNTESAAEKWAWESTDEGEERPAAAWDVDRPEEVEEQQGVPEKSSAAPQVWERPHAEIVTRAASPALAERPAKEASKPVGWWKRVSRMGIKAAPVSIFAADAQDTQSSVTSPYAPAAPVPQAGAVSSHRTSPQRRSAASGSPAGELSTAFPQSPKEQHREERVFQELVFRESMPPLAREARTAAWSEAEPAYQPVPLADPWIATAQEPPVQEPLIQEPLAPWPQGERTSEIPKAPPDTAEEPLVRAASEEATSVYPAANFLVAPPEEAYRPSGSPEAIPAFLGDASEPLPQTPGAEEFADPVQPSAADGESRDAQEARGFEPPAVASPAAQPEPVLTPEPKQRGRATLSSDTRLGDEAELRQGIAPRHRKPQPSVAPAPVAAPLSVWSATDTPSPSHTRSQVASQERAQPPEPPPGTAAGPGSVSRAAGTFPVQRPGLSRALRQIAMGDGPPARASEGLTAMRTGSGLHRAAAAMEAPLAAIPAAAEPDGQQGMSRRWAMLSRFGRTDGTEGSLADSPEPEAVQWATGKNGTVDPARDSRV